MTAGASFILVAAGRGKRMGGPLPKQYAQTAGLELWEWSARLADSLSRQSLVDELVLVVPAEDLEIFQGKCRHFHIPVVLAAGGEERSASVMNGLTAARGKIVLVHDAARPLASEGLCRELLEKARVTGGAIPVIPVADALKQYRGNRLETLDREGILRAQTPQAFAREELIEAMKRFGKGTRDESEAWGAAGKQVALVRGETANIKVTFPEDLFVAHSLLAGQLEWRTGFGYDIHPLVPGRKLILGGIRIPSRLGLDGHSDADCLCHAASDAILGGAGLPDIGTLFPASSEEYRDAFSLDLFREAADRVHREGWRISWIDLALKAQVPRLGESVSRIVDSMGKALGLGSGSRVVNLKVKSGEGLGVVGEGRCMKCHAVATLSRNVHARRYFSFQQDACP